MQSFHWAAEHCQALRDYRLRGLSYGEIARRLNATFGTTYTRNAALGRGVRMGLPSPERPPRRAKRLPKIGPQRRLKTTSVAELPHRRPAAPPRAKRLKLRCVGVTPRLIALIELGPNDCRYPYGGDKDGEAIAFCGHSKLAGSSYCAPHFHLTRGDGTPSERAASRVVLRLVEAA
jgi:GcrA cell cycle regulator